MTITREQVEALLAGCEGVTDGPWDQDDRISTWIMAGDLHVATIPQDHDGDWPPSNAAHIARCDPATITALCTAYLEAEDRVEAAVKAERDACAKTCEDQAVQFLSPEYATGQPLSSFNERFACKEIADAIRARSREVKT